MHVICFKNSYHNYEKHCLSFDRYNFTDVQAMCESSSDESSSSVRLLDVSSSSVLKYALKYCNFEDVGQQPGNDNDIQ